MNLADWITTNAERWPAKPALCGDDASLDYAMLSLRIEASASALLDAGVRRGDRVAWLGLNSASMLVTFFACARLGAVFMPLNGRLAPPEHQAALCEGAPKLLIADASFAVSLPDDGSEMRRCCSGGTAPEGWTDWSRCIADPPRGRLPALVDAPGAPVLLCWTSGATGRPKGVLLSTAALSANADASVAMHALRPDDRVLTTLPLFHVGGLNIQTLPALRSGAMVLLHARFDPEATFDAIERAGITLTVLVPAQLEALIAHPRWASADFSRLRMISTGSTTVPSRLIAAVHQRGVPLVQVWGATETAPIASCLTATAAIAKAGSAGRAALGCAIRVTDASGRDLPSGASGEVLVRGRNLMNGYWRDAEATARAMAGGWFHSGDLGHLDAEGYLWIDGRIKDLIISGGENVSPAEVEAVLLDNPSILEAAVVGRPDPRWGEAVVALIVVKPGMALEREAVLAPFRGRLASFKHPKDVVLVEALPRSALGKVRKDELRQWVAARTMQETLA